MTFDEAFERLMGHEGVLSVDPNDPGNWTGRRVNVGVLRGTKFGISAAQYPDEDIPNLTRERSKQLFRRDYWDVVNGDKLKDGVAWQAVDFAFNSGPDDGIRALQRAVRVTPDGRWGPISQAAADAADESDTIMLIIAERLRYMAGLSSWPSHGRGWVMRMARNLEYGADDS